MEDFLKTYFLKQEFQAEKLSGDGGHRFYTRLKTKNNNTYMLMNSGKEDQSLKNFVSIQQKLDGASCFVPKIFQKDFSKGLLLLEDLGDEMLEEIQNKEGYQKSSPYYFKALKQLISLQQQVEVSATDILFDKSFFQEEVNTAIQRLEKLLKIVLQEISYIEKENLKNQLKEEMEQIILQIVQTSFVYCHRDFHSRNMMIHNKEVYLLDFQDAGSGPFMYDLTSFIYDSYISFTNSERQNLIKFYFENLPKAFQKSIENLSGIERLVQLQFLQRGLKACGCFASFYSENQKATHLKYIQPTLQKLYEVAKNFNYKNTANYFKELKNRLDVKSFDKIALNNKDLL